MIESDVDQPLRVHPLSCYRCVTALSAAGRSLQSVYFLPAPWRRISGTVNRRVLDRLAGAVLSHCMAAPGCTLTSVQGHFHPMLTAHQTRLLVEVGLQYPGPGQRGWRRTTVGGGSPSISCGWWKHELHVVAQKFVD